MRKHKTSKQFILPVIYVIIYVMRKSKKGNKINTMQISINSKYIKFITVFLLVTTLLLGCTNVAPLMNTPTPLPSNTLIPTNTPDTKLLNSPELELSTSTNATPSYDETYPIPEILGNTGANIENGGLSTSDKNKIYYIDNGIWSISKNGANKEQITDMENISCLNDVGEFIYYLSSHDGSIYRVEKSPNSIPESLNISGASNLIVMGESMYYCSTIGENATEYIYKSPLQGLLQECLFIKATYISPDGAYFYFNNLEDYGTLWRYDTITSQIIKIANDRASQINVIDKKIYYISQDQEYNVVCIDRNGLNPVVVVTQGCTDINIINNYLIYRTIETGYIESYNIKTGDSVSLVPYGELFSLSATDSMLFFQSCPVSGLEPDTYIYDIVTSKLNKSLPLKIFAYVKGIRTRDLTLEYDTVDFYVGEEAIAQYAAYNGATLEDAKEAVTTDEGAFYVYNRNQAWLRCQSLDWTNITLIRRSTSLANSTPYTSSLEQLLSLFDNNPSIEGKLIFELTIIDNTVVDMNEVYYPLNNN